MPLPARAAAPAAAGAFGWVQHARNRATGEDVAVKFIELGSRFYPKSVGREGAGACPGAAGRDSVAARQARAHTSAAAKPAAAGPAPWPLHAGPLAASNLPAPIHHRSLACRYVEREIINHRLLAHPHIVGFKEVFVTQKHLAM